MSTDFDPEAFDPAEGRPGNPFVSDERWVVALGEVVEPEPGAEVLQLQRGGGWWNLPRELAEVRARFERPVTVSYARALVKHLYPDSELEDLTQARIVWLSPPRPYDDAALAGMLGVLRLVGHGRDPEQDPSGDTWWVTSDDGQRLPLSTLEALVWAAAHPGSNLAEIAQMVTEKLGTADNVALAAAMCVLPLVDWRLVHLDLAT
jgi:hypothetical protein